VSSDVLALRVATYSSLLDSGRLQKLEDELTAARVEEKKAKKLTNTTKHKGSILPSERRRSVLTFILERKRLAAAAAKQAAEALAAFLAQTAPKSAVNTEEPQIHQEKAVGSQQRAPTPPSSPLTPQGATDDDKAQSADTAPPQKSPTPLSPQMPTGSGDNPASDPSLLKLDKDDMKVDSPPAGTIPPPAPNVSIDTLLSLEPSTVQHLNDVLDRFDDAPEGSAYRVAVQEKAAAVYSFTMPSDDEKELLDGFQAPAKGTDPLDIFHAQTKIAKGEWISSKLQVAFASLTAQLTEITALVTSATAHPSQAPVDLELDALLLALSQVREDFVAMHCRLKNIEDQTEKLRAQHTYLQAQAALYRQRKDITTKLSSLKERMKSLLLPERKARLEREREQAQAMLDGINNNISQNELHRQKSTSGGESGNKVEDGDEVVELKGVNVAVKRKRDVKVLGGEDEKGQDGKGKAKKPKRSKKEATTLSEYARYELLSDADKAAKLGMLTLH
jgi:hypothetical protein